MFLFVFQKTFVSNLFIIVKIALFSVSEKGGGKNKDSQNPIIETYHIRFAEYQSKIL